MVMAACSWATASAAASALAACTNASASPAAKVAPVALALRPTHVDAVGGRAPPPTFHHAYPWRGCPWRRAHRARGEARAPRRAPGARRRRGGSAEVSGAPWRATIAKRSAQRAASASVVCSRTGGHVCAAAQHQHFSRPEPGVMACAMAASPWLWSGRQWPRASQRVAHGVAQHLVHVGDEGSWHLPAPPATMPAPAYVGKGGVSAKGAVAAFHVHHQVPHGGEFLDGMLAVMSGTLSTVAVTSRMPSQAPVGWSRSRRSGRSRRSPPAHHTVKHGGLGRWCSRGWTQTYRRYRPVAQAPGPRS